MDTIPNDIIKELISQSSTTKDIINLMKTCKKFKQLDDNKTFQDYYKKNYLHVDNIGLYDKISNYMRVSCDNIENYSWKRICSYHDKNVKEIPLHIKDNKYEKYEKYEGDTYVKCIEGDDNYLYDEYREHYLFNNILTYCKKKGINIYEIIVCNSLFDKVVTLGNMMCICKDGSIINKKMYNGKFIAANVIIDDDLHNSLPQVINSGYYTLIFIAINLLINIYSPPKLYNTII